MKIYHVFGNPLTIAIPLTKVIKESVGGEVVTSSEPYIPSSCFVTLMSVFDRHIYLAQIEDNIAIVSGISLPVGTYALEVLCDNDHRYFQRDAIQIVATSAEAGIEPGTEFDAEIRELDAACYLFVKGEKGDKGDIGATGPQGPKGDKGDPGDPADTDLVQRMAGIAALGYDPVAMGATLPLDLDGLAYAQNLLDLPGKIGNGQNSTSNADRNLVYLPRMDWNFRFLASSPDESPISEGFYEADPQRPLRYRKSHDSSIVSGKTYYLPSPFNPNSPTSINLAFYYCKNLQTIPDNPFSDGLKLGDAAFRACSSLKKVGNINTPFTMYHGFRECSNLEEVGDLTCPGYHPKNFESSFRDCPKLLKIGKIDFEAITSMSKCFTGSSQIRELTIINLGKSSLTTYDFSDLRLWGVDVGKYYSLHDTLSGAYDRRSHSMSNATLRFSSNIEDCISGDDIDMIVNKGYIIEFV